VALRERRGVTRTWLRVVAVVALALAVLALVNVDLVATGVLIAVVAAALFARDRWRPRTEPSDPRRLAAGLRRAGAVIGQTSRWRFR
jgi:membrane protein implicated in regulation of membrane protease activity